MQNTVLNKIKRAISSFGMLENGDSVLVGFSGGKDSVVLLHALHTLSTEYGIRLTALHVNHNIRGKEAERDQAFCEGFCKKYNIGFVCKNVYAPQYSAEHKVGLEEGARILRYEAFAETAAEKGITKTATAHTASDNLETLIFNLTRGSAAEGLKGIPPVRDGFIRPLIYCTTEDVLEYAEENGLDYVTDSTNSDTDYARNHIRHNVIPMLKKINPSAETAASNLCDSLRLDLSFISAAADKIDTDSPIGLSGLHPALLSRKLILMYKEQIGGYQLENVHVREMTELIREYVKKDCKAVKRISLPGGIDFTVTPAKVYFARASEKKQIAPRKLTMGYNPIEETGEAVYVTPLPPEELTAGLAVELKDKNIYKNSIHTIVKKSSLDGTIIRGRNNGDLFVFSNMTKKVKKMLNEAAVPLDERDRLPFICDEKGIIWIPGFPVRDDAVPRGQDEKILHIYYLKTGEKV